MFDAVWRDFLIMGKKFGEIALPEVSYFTFSISLLPRSDVYILAI